MASTTRIDVTEGNVTAHVTMADGKAQGYVTAPDGHQIKLTSTEALHFDHFYRPDELQRLTPNTQQEGASTDRPRVIITEMGSGGIGVKKDRLVGVVDAGGLTPITEIMNTRGRDHQFTDPAQGSRVGVDGSATPETPTEFSATTQFTHWHIPQGDITLGITTHHLRTGRDITSDVASVTLQRPGHGIEYGTIDATLAQDILKDSAGSHGRLPVDDASELVAAAQHRLVGVPRNSNDDISKRR